VDEKRGLLIASTGKFVMMKEEERKK